jgi:hypothetical protein
MLFTPPPLTLISYFLFVFKQANRPPAKLNLLTCQVKTNPEEKKCFDLISRRFFLRRCAVEKLFNTLPRHQSPVKHCIPKSWFGRERTFVQMSCLFCLSLVLGLPVSPVEDWTLRTALFRGLCKPRDTLYLSCCTRCTSGLKSLHPSFLRDNFVVKSFHNLFA